MTDTALPEADPELLPLASFKVYSIKQGEMLSVMMHLGDRLGLFRSMAHGLPATSGEIADAAGIQERWAREWLYAVSAAGVVEHERVDGVEQFHMTAEMSTILGQPDHPSYSGAVFGAPVASATIDRLVESFQTGVGFSWGDHGDDTAHMQAVMAEAFPNSTFVGIDPSVPAIAAARAKAAELGLANLTFEEQTFEDLAPGSVDFLLTLDVLHDIPRPAEAVRAARAALADDGVRLVADIKSSETFEENSRNPMIGLFYSMSVVYCMNSALSEPEGAGLGTLGMHPERLRGLVEAAGFASLDYRTFDEDVNNRYFEIRP